jgi:hypothetical protein
VALFLKRTKNSIDFIELILRQLMALHDALQALAPIGTRQAAPVEF